MPIPGNSINETTTGICGFTGTSFTGTPATNHAVLIGGSTSSTLTNVGPTATSGQVLQSAGSSADPVFSTATYPSTTTINQVLYSSSANVVGGITAVNNGTLISGATGIPSFLANGTTGQVLTATTGSPPSWAPASGGSISLTGDSGGALSGTSFTLTGGTTGHTFAGVGTTLTLGGTLVLANGGTSASLVASNGGVFYSTGTTGAILAGTATANKVLMSGATAAPTWSVPTFPNASATTRKIIVSDGTNWVASTETYAVPGTSGNVLTSDGTNWTSTAPAGGGFTTITGTLTNAQIKALRATPVQVIAAPGAGSFIRIISASTKMNYGGTNVFTAAASQTIALFYGTTTSILTAVGNAAIVASATQFAYLFPATAIGAVTVVDNMAVNLYNSVATEITGNAANNNTVSWSITYQVVTI